MHRIGIYLVATTLLAGCGSGSDPNTESSCPTSSEGIQTQILTPACGASSCHGAGVPALGLDLVSPGVTQRLVNVAANGCGDKTLVTPGRADTSYLLAKLSHDAPECGERMPLGAAPLSSQQMACLTTWVNQLGAGTGGATGSGGQTSQGGQLGASGQTSGGGQVGSGGSGSVVGGDLGSGGRSSGGQTGLGGSTSGGGQSSSGGQVGSGGAMPASGGGAGVSGCGPAIAFSSQVQPIFTAKCSAAGCHVGNRPSAGLSLAAGTAYSELVKVAASCSGKWLVKPGVVAESYLVDKLLGTNLCSGSQMPKAGSSLPAGDIAAITGWICEGAPNN